MHPQDPSQLTNTVDFPHLLVFNKRLLAFYDTFFYLWEAL